MAYEKQTFQDGQILYASQLNHIENNMEYLFNFSNVTLVCKDNFMTWIKSLKQLGFCIAVEDFECVFEGEQTKLLKKGAVYTFSPDTSELKLCFNSDCPIFVENISTDQSEESNSSTVTLITLDYTNIELDIGDSMQLAASVTPSNATNNTVLWKSSNTSIAIVDNGYVTAVAEGSAIITAYSAENNTIEATCSVTVAAESGETPTDPTNKVMFSTLTPVKEGVVLKKDGKTEYTPNRGVSSYYQLPYSEGMQISTVLHNSWITNYPPFLIVDGETITIPEYVDGGGVHTVIYKHYTVTLNGLSNNAKVYVNKAYTVESGSGGANAYENYCYYIAGGAE